MDEIKDIQKRDDLSRFLDSNVIRTHPFGRNVTGEKAYRRAERIVAALHLLSNHIPEEEPVRSHIRRSGIYLLSCLLALRDEMRAPESPAFLRTLTCIRKLISLVRILPISGFASRHNAEIMLEALDELGNFLAVSQRSALSESLILTKDELLAGGEVLSRHTLVTDIKDKVVLRDKSQKTTLMSDRANTPTVRGEGILQVLKSQNNLSIRDISSNLPEYSEKMIQRELAHMIAVGLVKKTGSKRWSRYSLFV